MFPKINSIRSLSHTKYVSFRSCKEGIAVDAHDGSSIVNHNVVPWTNVFVQQFLTYAAQYPEVDINDLLETTSHTEGSNKEHTVQASLMLEAIRISLRKAIDKAIDDAMLNALTKGNQ